MKSRPTIFLSGVSHEFGSFRDAVENEIEMKGCFAENQPGFPPDYRTVEEMLRRKLQDADAVIHIVGFRFGAEPNERPAHAPRRSYTQMEFDIAREMQKPVYVFLSTEASIRDEARVGEQPKDAETTRLQLAHRDAVQKANHLYYFFKDKVELCKLAAEIPPVQAVDFRADISRIIKYAPAQLIGRDDELKLLNDAWTKIRRAESPRPHILTFVALGGEGKTSLVTKWAVDLAYHNWPGCDGVFAWSFYSQGTREQTQASSDLFLAAALEFFGDAAKTPVSASAHDKGLRLSQLVGERRALLILDGLEPLQYPPTSPTPGELKDQGLAALLKGLASTNPGLCVVTTRYSIPDLKAFWQTTGPEHELKSLSVDAGVDLLKRLGVTGTQKEFEELVDDVDGHALTLSLLGGFLKRAFKGDIRQRDRVKFEKANEKIQGGHAFRAMAAYEEWLLEGGDEGRREVAILRLVGLFDRPADAGCITALRGESIAGLTEPIVGLEALCYRWMPTRYYANTSLGNSERNDPRRGAPPTDGFTDIFGRRHRTRSPIPRLKTSNPSTRQWPTAARRGCSRRRVTRFTAAASCDTPRNTVGGDSARSVPTWGPSPASSSFRGAVSRLRSLSPHELGC